MSQHKEQQTITLPLHDFIFCTLGDDLDGLPCAPVTPTVGMVLDNLLKNSLRWKVEFNDWDGNALAVPVLWRFRDWKEQSSRVERTRKYFEAERLKTGLELENIRRIKERLMNVNLLSEPYARILAWKLLKTGNMIVLREFGVTELATEEKHIQYDKPPKFYQNYLK